MKYPGGAGYFFFFPFAGSALPSSSLGSSFSAPAYFLVFALALPPGPPPTA